MKSPRTRIVLLPAVCLLLTSCQAEPAFPVSSNLTPQTPHELYVLMYHDVVPDGQPCGDWTVTAGRFQEDLQWLVDNEYQVVSVNDLAQGMPLPERAALITFDDGYRSNYTLAFPLLQQYNMPAAIALIEHYLDEEDPWYLTWDMCREMQQSGLVEIGSHTYNMHTMSRCIRRLKGETQLQYGARVFADLQKSIDRIETELGVPVRYFAYPNGRYDKWADDFMTEHFQVTVSSDLGCSDLSGGLYKLPRCNINMDLPPARFLPDLNGDLAAPQQ